jgi:hypothetical protein
MHRLGNPKAVSGVPGTAPESCMAWSSSECVFLRRLKARQSDTADEPAGDLTEGFRLIATIFVAQSAKIALRRA